MLKTIKTSALQCLILLYIGPSLKINKTQAITILCWVSHFVQNTLHACPISVVTEYCPTSDIWYWPSIHYVTIPIQLQGNNLFWLPGAI